MTSFASIVCLTSVFFLMSACNSIIHCSCFERPSTTLFSPLSSLGRHTSAVCTPPQAYYLTGHQRLVFENIMPCIEKFGKIDVR